MRTPALETLFSDAAAMRSRYRIHFAELN